MKIRTSPSLIAWYIRLCGFKGYTSFWRVIYVMPGHEHNDRKHLEQIERDGRILFGIKRLWWLCRYGYWRNPYEVEVRVAANKHK